MKIKITNLLHLTWKDREYFIPSDRGGGEGWSRVVVGSRKIGENSTLLRSLYSSGVPAEVGKGQLRARERSQEAKDRTPSYSLGPERAWKSLGRGRSILQKQREEDGKRERKP